MKRKMLKITAAVIAVLALAGCSADVPDEMERVSETTALAVEKNTENEEFPKVTPANELYDVYPVRIIPPQNGVKKINAETENIQEELYNSEGVLIGVFHANYPVISGYSEEVCERINAEIKGYVDGVLEAARQGTEMRGIEKGGGMSEEAREFYENDSDKPTILFYDDSAGDNFFCMNFVYMPNTAGTAPDHVYSAPMIFDLRTGERVDFENLISDREGFASAMENALKQIVIMNDQNVSADGYGKAMGEDIKVHEYFSADFGDGEDGYLIGNHTPYERISVKNGCVGFYYTFDDFGIAVTDSDTGVYWAGIPFDEAARYLTDRGKELFAGYLSAESVPANVIEYKGGRYFDTLTYIPDILDEGDITEGDRDFISLFKDAGNFYFEKYGVTSGE